MKVALAAVLYLLGVAKQSTFLILVIAVLQLRIAEPKLVAPPAGDSR